MTLVNVVSPELVLVDPALACAEGAQSPLRLDERDPSAASTPAARASWIAPTKALFAALLVSLLLNGLLTSIALFGHRTVTVLQPSVPPPTQPGSVADAPAAAGIAAIDIPPIDPAQAASP